jgi:hypothetical protein
LFLTCKKWYIGKRSRLTAYWGKFSIAILCYFPFRSALVDVHLSQSILSLLENVALSLLANRPRFYVA